MDDTEKRVAEAIENEAWLREYEDFLTWLEAPIEANSKPRQTWQTT